MEINQPNMKYAHVYAVIRIDDLGSDQKFHDDYVYVTKVFWSQERADEEAQRLNGLNGTKGAHYFVRVTRIESPTTSEDLNTPVSRS